MMASNSAAQAGKGARDRNGVRCRLAALHAMSTVQLRAEWSRVLKSPAPALPADLLLRTLAYDLQVRAEGGLSVEARRTIRTLVKQLGQAGEISPEREVVLKPGTQLARDWHGATHHVLVVEDGFVLRGQKYSSLTRIAQEITGARWSGPRLFGLTRRPKPFAEQSHG
jgi:hypothetical protein